MNFYRLNKANRRHGVHDMAKKDEFDILLELNNYESGDN